MKTSWRTIQVFISAAYAGVFEVEIDTATRETRCNCPVYAKEGTCKHTRFVNRKSKFNDGAYAISIPTGVPEEAVEDAIDDPEKFRDLILKYSTIEVL
jgi:hypothetical protein